MPTYQPSPKHCEPVTAQRPGLKCPDWSRGIARDLLSESIVWGEKRVATRNGIAFVAQLTRPSADAWHGYPESWDNIDWVIKQRWLAERRIRRQDLRSFGTREQLRDAFGGSLHDRR